MTGKSVFEVQTSSQLTLSPNRTQSPKTWPVTTIEISGQRPKTASKVISEDDNANVDKNLQKENGSTKIIELSRSVYVKTAKEIFASGLLEGHKVEYNGVTERVQGLIKDTGIMCFCDRCLDPKVMWPCAIKFNDYNSYFNVAHQISLDNGTSLLEVVKACCQSHLEPLNDAIKRVVRQLPLKQFTVSLSCNDTEIVGCIAADAERVEFGAKNAEITEHNELSVSTKNLNDRFSKADLGSRIPKSSSLSTVAVSLQQKTKSKIRKRDTRLHKMIFEKGGLPEGTEVVYKSNGQSKNEGVIKGTGIYCHCCSSVVSASTFEAHAGHATRRKPYNYIYIKNGASLHAYSVSLMKNRNCGDAGDVAL